MITKIRWVYRVPLLVLYLTVNLIFLPFIGIAWLVGMDSDLWGVWYEMVVERIAEIKQL